MDCRVSVVICTYNRANLLEGALRSLDTQTMDRRAYEIVVVDDGSTDDSPQAAARAQLQGSFQYHRIEHAGRAAARNEGIARAKGEVILFVDDDILAPPTLIEQHWRYHMKHPQSVVRGPIVLVPEYKVPEDYRPTWRDRSAAFFCTCNASVSKQALVSAGGFDASFVEYGFEDNELGWRLRQGGCRARFNLHAVVFHYKPPLQQQDLNALMRQAEELGRSAVAYYRKHPHWRVGLATGLHVLLRPWNRLLSSERLYAWCRRIWDQRNNNGTQSSWKSFAQRRMFVYHYLRSMERERLLRN